MYVMYRGIGVPGHLDPFNSPNTRSFSLGGRGKRGGGGAPQLTFFLGAGARRKSSSGQRKIRLAAAGWSLGASGEPGTC